MANKKNLVEAKITLDSKDFEKNLSNVSKKTESENKKIKKSLDNVSKTVGENNKKIELSNNNLAKNYGILRTTASSDMEKIKNASNKMKNASGEASEKIKKDNDKTSNSFNFIKKAAENTKGLFITATNSMSNAMSNTSSKVKSSVDSMKAKLNELINDSQKAAKAMEDIGKSAEKAGNGIKGAGDKLSNSLTKPVTAVGTLATGLAVSFDSAFAKVNTLLDLNEKELADYEAELQKTAVEMNTDLGEFAEAVYQAISAGVDYSEAIDFVGKSVKLSKGGFMETSAAVDTLTTVLNTYGDKAGDVTTIQDKLIATQNKGKTTVGELGMALADIIPNANALSVNFDDLLGSMAHLTAGGMKTASAGTKLRSMLDELGKSGTKASDVLKEKTGKSFKELMESGKSLDEVLLIVNQGAKEAGVSLADMFGSTEAAGAANAIIGNLEGFRDSVDAVKDSAGSAEIAYQKMANTMKEKIKGAVVDMQSSLVDLGQKMEPLLDALIEFAKKIPEMLNNIDFEAVIKPFLDILIQLFEKLGELINWFGKLDKGTQNFILKAVLLGAALGPVLKIIGDMTLGFSSIMKVGSSLVKFFGSSLPGSILKLASSHAPVILAVMAVIGVVMLLAKNWDKVKEAGSMACDFIKDKWSGVCEWFNNLWNGITEGAKNAFDWLGSIVEAGLQFIGDLIGLSVDVITLPWQFIWQNFGDTITQAINIAVQWLKDGFNNMIELFSSFKETASNAFSLIKDTISSMWGNMIGFISEKWQGFTSWWSGITSSCSETVKSIINGVVDKVKTGFTTATEFAKSKWNGLFDSITGIIDKIKNAVSNLVSKLKNAFNFKWSLPKIKLPHFSISGSFSLNPPKVPKFGIEWRHNGAIFSRPTVMANGQGVGDGFKGMGAQKEAVLPIEKLPDLLGLNERQGGDFTLNIERFENNREIDIEQLVKEIGYFGRKRGLNFGI